MTTLTTTPGKYRHLGRCSRDGVFFILAIDHRENLRRLLDKAAGSPTDDAALTAFKQAILQHIARPASAVLTDPAFGIGAGIANGAIGSDLGLLAPVEVTDYDAHPGERDMAYIPGWSVTKIKRVGGDGVKLLLPYHPDGPKAPQHREAVAQIVAECIRHDIPFFLEPIPYSLDPARKLDNAELRQVSIENARTFSAMGVDVLKVPFPVDAAQSDDEGEWRAACAELDAACSVPWALLSAGVSYAVFARQAQIACSAGASGVIVGRAVWAEAVTLQGAERQQFIETTAVERMVTLRDICAAEAVPWTQRVTMGDLPVHWYETYGED